MLFLCCIVTCAGLIIFLAMTGLGLSAKRPWLHARMILHRLACDSMMLGTEVTLHFNEIWLNEHPVMC